MFCKGDAQQVLGAHMGGVNILFSVRFLESMTIATDLLAPPPLLRMGCQSTVSFNPQQYIWGKTPSQTIPSSQRNAFP